MALVSLVKGLASAIGWSHHGMFSGSTKAEEMNVSGNIQMKPAELAASTDFTDSPMNAWIQEKA